MLTAFKHNPEATKFFKNTLKYEIDETCPLDDVHEQFDYEILSKFNKRKLAREAQEQAANGNEVWGFSSSIKARPLLNQLHFTTIKLLHNHCSATSLNVFDVY